MLVWKPGNFKILIVGVQVDVIPIVERRIGQVISLPIDIHYLSLERFFMEETIPTLDLILVDKVYEEHVRIFHRSRVNAQNDFVPCLMFHWKEEDSGGEIEFCT